MLIDLISQPNYTTKLCLLQNRQCNKHHNTNTNNNNTNNNNTNQNKQISNEKKNTTKFSMKFSLFCETKTSQAVCNWAIYEWMDEEKKKKMKQD